MKTKSQVFLPRNESAATSNDKSVKKNRSAPVDIENLSIVDLKKHEKRNLGKSESYTKQSNSSENLFSLSHNNSSYQSSSSHQPYLTPQNGSQSHFQRSAEQVKLSAMCNKSGYAGDSLHRTGNILALYSNYSLYQKTNSISLYSNVLSNN